MTSQEEPVKFDSLPCEEREIALKARIDELEEIETKRLEFKKAGELQKKIWVHAIDALPFFVKLRKARDHAVDNNKPWSKIVFQIAEDGKVTDLALNEAEAEESS